VSIGCRGSVQQRVDCSLRNGRGRTRECTGGRSGAFKR